MTPFESTVDCFVFWGARAGVGLGYTVEAVAVRLADDIAELRNDGGIPEYVRTVITVLPQQRVLEIRVEGLSVEADPDRTTIREVTHRERIAISPSRAAAGEFGRSADRRAVLPELLPVPANRGGYHGKAVAHSAVAPGSGKG